MAKRYQGQYTGYARADDPVPPALTDLTSVGPRSPCGEYMRQFWQPVARCDQVTRVPVAIQVLGEELVVFRRPDGVPGLLHRHCAHRGVSLEYGHIEERGIRCCYHGWLYGVDGQLLETPLEPPTSTLRRQVKLGAYPVHEHAGLIFAFFGPPEREPPLPLYDTLQMSDTTYLTSEHLYPSSWVHLAENALDRAHMVYLHTLIPETPRFQSTWQIPPHLEYHETETGYRVSACRRVGDKIWIELSDFLLPNFSQTGALLSVSGNASRHYGRGTTSRWLVPVDDEHTRVFVVAHFNEDSDPLPTGYGEHLELERMETGALAPRDHDTCRLEPSLREVVSSQRDIQSRRGQPLATTDHGLAVWRKKLRNAIRDLAGGQEPRRPAEKSHESLATCAGDIVLEIPLSHDDAARMSEVARAVIGIYGQADRLDATRRRQHIEEQLRRLEQNYRLR